MKYNININQKQLESFETLDLKDCAIFDYIKQMCSSNNPKIEKQREKGHTWINYERLIEDMPLLRIKSRNSITPRIKKLEKEGLITTISRMIHGHRRVFVKMTTLSDSVFVESTERVRGNEKRVRETVQDYNTINTITKENTTDPQLKEKFEMIRSSYKSLLKGKARGLDTEWDNFSKKNTSTLQLLEEIFNGASNMYKEKKKENDKWETDGSKGNSPFTYTPNFSTFINQRKWEEYL